VRSALVLGVMIKPMRIAGKEQVTVIQILAWSAGCKALRGVVRVAILPYGGQAG
jgi:hypothetical protein